MLRRHCFSLFNCAEAACRIAVPAVKAGHTVDYCDSAEQNRFSDGRTCVSAPAKNVLLSISPRICFPRLINCLFVCGTCFRKRFFYSFPLFFQERVYRYASGGKMHPHSRKAEFRSTAHPPYAWHHPRFFPPPPCFSAFNPNSHRAAHMC